MPACTADVTTREIDISKRGDHLFATGLSKTIGDVADRIGSEIGDCSEGRVLFSTVSRCSRLLTGGVFDAVLDKGKPVLHDGAHSAAFGDAVKGFRLQMASLVFALKFRRGLDGDDQRARAQDLDLANRQLATSKHCAVLATGRFFDGAMDEAVARRLMATTLRGEVVAAQATLESVRQAICRCIEKV